MLPAARSRALPLGRAGIALAMTERAALVLAGVGARPSVACWRSRHLPLAGERGRLGRNSVVAAKCAFGGNSHDVIHNDVGDLEDVVVPEAEHAVAL